MVREASMAVRHAWPLAASTVRSVKKADLIELFGLKKRPGKEGESVTLRMEVGMLDRLVEIFCAMDDFCKAFFLQWAALQLSAGKAWERGPECGLSVSEIMTIVALYHGSRYRYFKNFYSGVVLNLLKQAFPGLPSYERFIALKPRSFIPRLMFLASRSGRKTGIYYVDSTTLLVCHNRRIARHKVFAGLAARGKTSMGWFFGFKLHLVFNHEHEIVALKLTPGNVSDTAPVISLVKGLTGELFGDKGYIGKKLATTLLRQGLA
jgi:Transposase DDE domain